MPLLQQLLLLVAAWCHLALAGRASCPGRIGLRGHGSVSLVPAGWQTAAESGEVEVLGETVVMPHLRGRAYFADSCADGVYNQSSYLALKVLGKTLRYTTDLKGAGCGCNAGFYLVPMSQNEQPSTCHDYYCDANSVCGVSCAEVDIQEANQYAWHTTLHTSDDSDGLAGGNGGGGSGSGHEGPRDWPNAQYAPGSGCIDTSRPFQVSASFPVDAAGNLIALELTLSQEGHTCSLPTQVSGYAGLKELSRILAKGVTPVVSYWSSNNMRWLDGPGNDGRGPCSNDTATECHESVQFYDFSIKDIKALPRDAGVPKPAAAGEEDRIALTCPGAVPVKGYGSISLVPAGWHGPPSPHVLVAASPDAVKVNASREVVLHSGSRGFFADTCEAGSYNNWEYVAWDLLGKRLRYTTDVSQVGCGCTAALYLIPMRHNTEAGECGDFYCDASSLCGVSCAEIVIQEANNLTWLSSLRSHKHVDGLQQWTFPGYSSGAKCVDPSRPFEVVVDFPLNESGQLTSLKVRAEQGENSCDLHMPLGDNNKALAEFSQALAKGVTPVVSHWRQGSFRSGDVVGAEDCTPMECSAAAKFYGFSVQSMFPGRPGGPSPGPSSKSASQAEATQEAASTAVSAAVAELMGEEKEVDREKEREPRCPGSVSFKGLGSVSLVPNGWKTGSIGTAGVDVQKGREVVTGMGSRAYFADSCTAGAYKREHYLALNLLGKTLRYTTDLSGAGCGCNAALYLVSMRQNPRPSECYDYYCDANNVCGESCDEIDIQEGNMFAWHSTLHTWKDHNGLSGGFGGGGENWDGPRDWNVTEFGPGAACINTNHPVQVSVSFPLDQAGSLSGMEVTLTQEQSSSCSLQTRTKNYDGLSELSAALSLGMTPVVSYWSSDDMLWLDGAGKDGLGPCAQDNASTCSAAVRFYDFELEDMPAATSTAIHDSDVLKGDSHAAASGPPSGPGFCPGEVHVAGHGKVALVPSGNTSHQPGKLATVVDGREVRSAIGGRIYFADSCTPESYDPKSFGAWKLLGKTLRYTTDVSRAGVSGAGCGCTAALYLVAMPQNQRPGACGDYYCDASGACGESCVEIDVQKANKFAWHTTIHSAKDQTGLSVQGGGYDWNGPRVWTSSQYAPGAKCIDTARPFEVAVSFPADSEGKLLALEVNLTQAGCSLAGRIHGYEEMPAVSAALEAGMTPVISYSSESDSLLETGHHQDECSANSGTRCAESVSFYDLVVEELAPKVSTTAVAAPLAISPELSAGEAAEKVLARLKSMEEAEAIALQKAQESMVEDSRQEAAEAAAQQADGHHHVKATVQLAPQLPLVGPAGEPQEDCAEAFKQCGGFGFNKQSCCLTGCHCQAQSVYYSQCIPVVQEQDSCEAAATATVAGLAAAIGAPAPAPVAAVFAAAAPMVTGTLGASSQRQPTLPPPRTIRPGHEEFLIRKSASQESVDPLRQRLLHGDLLATAVLGLALVAMTVAVILARKRTCRRGPCDAENAQRALALRYHPLPFPEVISRDPTEEIAVGEWEQATLQA